MSFQTTEIDRKLSILYKLGLYETYDILYLSTTNSYHNWIRVTWLHRRKKQ